MKRVFINPIIATKMVLLNNMVIRLKSFPKVIKYFEQCYFLKVKIKKMQSLVK